MDSIDRYIFQAEGAARTLEAAEIFFQSCVNRLGDHQRYQVYRPWMASHLFSKKIAEGKTSLSFDFADKPLNFEREYLDSLATFFRSDKDMDIFADLSNHRIFSEIADIRPQSISIYSAAYQLVGLWPHWQKLIFHKLIRNIIPICLKVDTREVGNSSSNRRTIAAILASVDRNSPYPEISLNIDFSHELAHQVLMIYQHAGDLILDGEAWIYSGIRKTLRPAAAALHSAVALGYMTISTEALENQENNISRKAYLKALLYTQRKALQLNILSLEGVAKSALCEKIFLDLKSVAN